MLARRVGRLERQARADRVADGEDVAERCLEVLACVGTDRRPRRGVTWREIEAAELPPCPPGDHWAARQSVALGLLKVVIAVSRRLDAEGLD